MLCNLMRMKDSMAFALQVRVVPQNVCDGGVACTLNTRYEDAAVMDYTSLRHYPKTAWIYVYETE